MRPSDVQFVVGLSGYFVKDLQAVRETPNYSPPLDNASPRTPGFKTAVQGGQVISVLLFFPNGETVVGDCVDVIFSGDASRDPLFVAEEHIPILESAALLAATSLVHRCTAAEVITREWNTTIAGCPINILASCHQDDTLQLDRVIMKGASMLPHASFVSPSDIRPQGSKLLDYVRSVSRRIQARARHGYHPRLHLDVYGTLGDVFPELEELASSMRRIHQRAEPYEVLIESPIVASTKTAQIQQLAELRRPLLEKSIDVELVGDEWCNTLEDIKEVVDASAVDFVQVKKPDLGGVHNSIDGVLYCRAKGVGCVPLVAHADVGVLRDVEGFVGGGLGQFNLLYHTQTFVFHCSKIQC
ncbi:hypothetical protein FQN54_000110 [Arachnomyces sp. PD_36]|nr:hypothetical protein FQN54_000110 [Arachnomyces sp. PD_36]